MLNRQLYSPPLFSFVYSLGRPVSTCSSKPRGVCFVWNGLTGGNTMQQSQLVFSLVVICMIFANFSAHGKANKGSQKVSREAKVSYHELQLSQTLCWRMAGAALSTGLLRYYTFGRPWMIPMTQFGKSFGITTPFGNKVQPSRNLLALLVISDSILIVYYVMWVLTSESSKLSENLDWFRNDKKIVRWTWSQHILLSGLANALFQWVWSEFMHDRDLQSSEEKTGQPTEPDLQMNQARRLRFNVCVFLALHFWPCIFTLIVMKHAQPCTKCASHNFNHPLTLQSIPFLFLHMLIA